MIQYSFALLALCGVLHAAAPLVVKDNEIHTISSFDSVDYFTTFSSEGRFLWEIPFGTKIESFQKTGERVYFLSKMRDGSAYFVTCVEAEKGKLIWEKGISAPQPNEEDLDLSTLSQESTGLPPEEVELPNSTQEEALPPTDLP